jgi:hypothetical protein
MSWLSFPKRPAGLSLLQALQGFERTRPFEAIVDIARELARLLTTATGH